VFQVFDQIGNSLSEVSMSQHCHPPVSTMLNHVLCFISGFLRTKPFASLSLLFTSSYHLFADLQTFISDSYDACSSQNIIFAAISL